MFLERKSKPQEYLENYIADRPYLSGLITGLAAGLAIGFLFAPRSGKDLRKKIAGTVEDQTKGVQEQWHKTKAQAKETIDSIKTNVGLVADKAEDEFNVYVDKAVKNANEAEKLADNAVKEADRIADEAKSGFNSFKDNNRIS
jgi:gas vesicle protein